MNSSLSRGSGASRFVEKGTSRVHSSQSMMPRLYISTLESYVPSNISGADQSSVPIICVMAGVGSFACPRSPTLTWNESLTKMFNVFRSRWITSWVCKQVTARQVSRAIRSRSCQGNTVCRLCSTAQREPRDIHSMTMQSGSVQKPRSWTILGWRRDRRATHSSTNFSCVGLSNACIIRNCFTATGTLCHRASDTLPVEPVATSLRIRRSENFTRSASPSRSRSLLVCTPSPSR
mmetsp:Transcript_35264/g.80544  ORF Transcript_35264/g.80544 Transcript_35264/m.80544 type:complete len:234 (+) Transcript_35264:2289-2990(+)